MAQSGAILPVHRKKCDIDARDRARSPRAGSQQQQSARYSLAGGPPWRRGCAELEPTREQPEKCGSVDARRRNPRQCPATRCICGGSTRPATLSIGSEPLFTSLSRFSSAGTGGGGGCPTVDFVAKLAALIPRPHKNLVLYHGVLAANSSWRLRVVRHGRCAEVESSAWEATAVADPPSMRPRRAQWAELMR
jgi:hypothetical protein